MSLDNEALNPGISGATADASMQGTPATGGEPSRWKSIASKVSLVLFVILAMLSLLTVYVAAELLDTDRYVDTVTEIAADPDVQEAVATQISDRLIAYVDSTFEGDDGSGDTGPVASLALNAVDQAIQRVVLETVQSEKFQEIWVTANELAHPEVVAMLRGEDVANLSTSDGQVAIDLTPVVVEVQSRLAARGINVLDDVSTEPGEHMFVLFESESLESAQAANDFLITARWVLLLLTLVTLVLTIVFAADKGRGVVWVGLGFAIAMALALVAIALGEQAAVDRLDSGTSAAAVESTIDIVTQDLRTLARALAVVGLAVAVVAYVLLPGGACRAAIERYVVPHRQVLYGVIPGVGCLAIVLMDDPIGFGLVIGLLAGAIAIGLIWWISRNPDQASLAS